MTFQVGQKVVCVTNELSAHHKRHALGKPSLIVGNIYTIRGFVTSSGQTALLLEGLDWDHGYWAWRFRPIVERKTDTGMAILRKLLNTKQRKEVT